MAVAVQSSAPSTCGGEADAAARLFEQHADRLLAYCTRFLGSRADAEDAVQTTFLYAQRALERGVVPESEYAWLHAIAKNVCRWQQRTVARRGRLATDLDLDAFPAGPGFETELHELRLELEDALASIPEGQRRAFLMREWQGLSSDEVASRLGMSPAATYALLTRARRSLARALSATTRRPVLGLDFGSLALKLKGLLAGGAAKFAAVTIAVGTVAAGGVAAQQLVADRKPASPQTPSPASSSARAADGTVMPATAVPGTPSALPDVVLPPTSPDTSDAPGSVAPAAGSDAPAGSDGGSAPAVQPTDPARPANETAKPAPGSKESEGPLDPLVDPLLDPLLDPLPVPDVELPPLPVDVPSLPPVDPPKLPPVNAPDLPPVELPEPPPVEVPKLPPTEPLADAPPLPPVPDVTLPLP